ncbi:Calcium binding protein from Anabaena CcbP [Burkholderiales bacterium JOSHI_001]|nr:Calcium binding protein from Anabaena CcbP [Burkholderiales bacterium JOSHI_001]
MPRRVREDPAREDRILFEIVVDAYNETERAMSWYYYLQDKLKLPFTAKCRLPRAASPTTTHLEVVVLAMAPEDECMSEVHVIAKAGRSKLTVPLEQLECLSEDSESRQAVSDWHYWRARGYMY